MKKSLLYFAGLALLFAAAISCEQSAMNLEDVQALEKESQAEKGHSKDKVTICHYDEDLDQFHSITISTSALDKHMAHGDKYPSENPSPIGSFVALSSGKYTWDMVITTFDEITGEFTGTGSHPAGADTYKYVADFTGTIDEGFHLNGWLHFGNGHLMTGMINSCGAVEYLDWKWALIVDEDNDCYYSHEDCDDYNPEVNPGIKWYLDADGDGFGNPAVEKTFSLPDCDTTGYVLDNTDCDDSNDTVYPGALELCDGLDNDCDGFVPEDEIDNDGDGLSECEGDCDDTKLPFDPTGEIYFYYTSDGGTTLHGLHYMNIDTWDGTTFSGTGKNLNNYSAGGAYYERPSAVTVTGTIDPVTHTFTGKFYYTDSGSATWRFNGYINECGGITLDTTQGSQFVGPITNVEETDPDGNGYYGDQTTP